MNDFRDNLLTEMIHIYGFEHPITLQFAKMCEELPETQDEVLIQLVKAHQEYPMYDIE